MAVAPSLQFSVQPEADDFGNQHGRWLAEHGGFRLDATDAPAEHAKAIDHGGVRVGADHGIGISRILSPLGMARNHAREIFEIHLVADAGVGRHHFEIVKCRLAPAEKRVALDVALKFQFGVEAESVDAAEVVHLHGMIDDQFRGQQRIDAFGIAAHALHALTHGGQIDDGGNAGEILQQNARGHEGNFFFRRSRLPVGERLNIGSVDEAAVFEAQKIFEQNAERERKLGEIGYAVFFERFQTMNFETLCADAQRIARAKRVSCGDSHPLGPFAGVQPSMITEIEMRRGRLYWGACRLQQKSF